MNYGDSWMGWDGMGWYNNMCRVAELAFCRDATAVASLFEELQLIPPEEEVLLSNPSEPPMALSPTPAAAQL
jgi:hypothetical protein